MILSFHPCLDADVQVILGDRAVDSEIQKSIRSADAIILPQACAQNLYEICVASGATVFPNYEARIQYPGKIGQAKMFQDLGLPHPKTLVWDSVRQFTESHPSFRGMPHQIPFLIKEDMRHEGEGIFVIDGREVLKETLDRLVLCENAGMRGFVTQDHVPCQGNVLRGAIIGRRIITYWKRPGEPGQAITTISRGAMVDPDWRPDLQERGRVRALGLSEKTGINLGAVDMVFPMGDKDPEPLFLEINYYFGRRGLGGAEAYYRLLYAAIQEWLADRGMDPRAIHLI